MWFAESVKYKVSNVKMGFYNSDDEPFNGVLGILAHAFSLESNSG